MNTPSHLIINAALNKRLRGVTMSRSAFLLGSVIPDIPLFLLYLGGLVYYRYILGDASIRSMDPLFDQLYFGNPWWIAAHNFFHALLLQLPAITICWNYAGRPGTRRHWVFWFAAGCLIHTLIDIATHANDGPLLLFPLDWHTRFHSPISYWDPRYHGVQFTIFELSLDLLLLAYLLWPWLQRRLAAWRRRSAVS